MPISALDFSFLLTTCLVTSAAVIAARRAPDSAPSAIGGPTRSRLWTWGGAALVGYSLARDVAVVALMRRSGFEPWVFVFVDLASVVPYLLAAPRVVRAAGTGNLPRMAGWGACLAFGVLAPGSYVALSFSGTGGPVMTLALAYLVFMSLACIYGLARKARRQSAQMGEVPATSS